MSENFDSEFENIINNNSFAAIHEDDFGVIHEDDFEELEIAMDEAAHVLECISETSLIISSGIAEALESNNPFTLPKAAIEIFKALHALHEEFLTIVTTECDCEDCQGEEDDD